MKINLKIFLLIIIGFTSIGASIKADASNENKDIYDNIISEIFNNSDKSSYEVGNIDDYTLTHIDESSTVDGIKTTWINKDNDVYIKNLELDSNAKSQILKSWDKYTLEIEEESTEKGKDNSSVIMWVLLGLFFFAMMSMCVKF